MADGLAWCSSIKYRIALVGREVCPLFAKCYSVSSISVLSLIPYIAGILYEIYSAQHALSAGSRVQ